MRNYIEHSVYFMFIFLEGLALFSVLFFTARGFCMRIRLGGFLCLFFRRALHTDCFRGFCIFILLGCSVSVL